LISYKNATELKDIKTLKENYEKEYLDKAEERENTKKKLKI
jgi:hypothetical protein